jgi:hypothetical protein
MDNIEVNNVVSVDSTNGIFSYIFTPSSVSHTWRESYIKIENSMMVGHSDDNAASCMSEDPPITKNSPPGNWDRSGATDRAGIVFTIFANGGVIFGKPWHHAMSYNAIRGTMYANVRIIHMY